MKNIPQVKAFFDERTNTISYIVWEEESKECAIIDSVLDYELEAGRTFYHSVELLAEFIDAENLNVKWIIETHVHADHLSAAQWLKKRYNAPVVVSENITSVQKIFADIFDEGQSFSVDGTQFDILASEKDKFEIGNISGYVMFTPGHTPACMSIIFGDAVFVGDTMFMPDFGTARCDFPGGDAKELYDSIQKILTLPDGTRLFTGHDYKAPERDFYAWETTVGEQRLKNIHIAEQGREGFSELRHSRDANLSVPKLIIPAVQINMRAGLMPEPAKDGSVFLKVPLNKF